MSRATPKAGRKRPPKQVYRLWTWEELFAHPHIRRWRFHDRDNPKRQVWERIKREVKAERKQKSVTLAGAVPPRRSWAERIDRGEAREP